MARKFGKKTHVSLNPLDCSIIFLGSPKIGKTTLMKEVADRTVGEDGYMFLEMYRESGADMIEGIVAEDVESWEKFDEIVSDIEENKDTDYADLKVIFIDTWDNAILLAEKEALRLWNKNNPEHRTDNINQAYQGFQRGQDKAAELLDEMKYRLEAVGVKVSIIMHIKTKEISDPVSEKTYQQVTADVSQKYFNRIKKNCDVIAVGYVDREIVTEKTGRKDVKGKDITIERVKSEARKIKFRDSGYAIDAGGRLKHIVEDIEFNADDFINAITDALKAEVSSAGVDLKAREKEDKAREKEEAKIASENSAKARTKKAEAEEESNRDEYLAQLQTSFKSATTEQKEQIKAMMAEVGCSKLSDPELPIGTLKSMIAIFA